MSETIAGYAWLIHCVLDMAPERNHCDIRFILGDGILASGNILTKLGIQNTCRIILDHHHLLSLEIGARPKAFGLKLFSHTLLKKGQFLPGQQLLMRRRLLFKMKRLLDSELHQGSVTERCTKYSRIWRTLSTRLLTGLSTGYSLACHSSLPMLPMGIRSIFKLSC
ncbi:hypothetical protein IV203_033791 [Nitzschia inconspicua]|uniref:Uncharacterized protein n=1 Tax=Nitzschia inconspicua TaxID=303405 RepID=A0A9K3M342_9STRA|nr:hypothetical protein IV203_033791 [Nitzschia inconspicua]